MDRKILAARAQAERAWEAMDRAASEVNSLETALYKMSGTTESRSAARLAQSYDNDITGIQQRMDKFVRVLGDLLEAPSTISSPSPISSTGSARAHRARERRAAYPVSRQ